MIDAQPFVWPSDVIEASQLVSSGKYNLCSGVGEWCTTCNQGSSAYSC